MTWRAILAGLVILGAIAFTAQLASPRPQAPTLIVGAASDLQFAFEEIGPLFEAEKGVKVEFTFGSSGNLAQQIENGAPIDVYASADRAYVDQLSSKGLVLESTRQVYAIGRLALVGSKAAGWDPKRLEDLVSPLVKHIALANPDHAPYGRAARQALERTGIWEQVQPKIVYGENIRQAMQFVQTGNAEAGIVALSIAGVPEVTSLIISESLHDPLLQEMAVVRGSLQERPAREFIAFTSGPQARSIMKKYGYIVPGEP